MAVDKLRSLKKALLYSYQAAIAVLPNGNEFKCLINPDKNKPAYDNKIISIPYRDICLNAPMMGKTTQGEIDVDLKVGDVFMWKQTYTYWLVYLKYLEEDAYFRAEIRRCDQQIEINGKKYWVYLRGPVETSIEWNQKSQIAWNDLNYSLVMYVTSDENTQEYFERFKLVKIVDPRNGKKKNWQVAGVDPYYGDGILQIFLDEYYENSIEDAVAAQKQKEPQSQKEQDKTAAYIDGPTEIKQYGKGYFSIKNANNGQWFIKQGNNEQRLNYNKDILPLTVPGKLGTFTLIYRVEDKDDVELNVTIISL